MLMVSLLASLCMSLALAASAGAVVTEVAGTKVGLQPRNVGSVDDGRITGEFRDAGSGPVLSSNQTIAIYWEPDNNYYNVWQATVNNFLAGVGVSSGSLGSVFAVDTQYSDPANQHALYQSAAHGAYLDFNPYPTTGNCTDPAPLHAGKAITCLTDAQIREQLESFIAEHNLPKGLGAIYYMLTPPGVAVCLAADHCSDYPGTPEQIESDEAEHEESSEAFKIYKKSFCSYHSDINPDNAPDGDQNTVLYAVIPWIAGGEGDYHLASEDQTQAYDCQDGAYLFNQETYSTEKEAPKVSVQEENEKRLAAEKKENEELTAFEEQYKKGLISEAELVSKRAELKKAQEKREAKEKLEREEREKREGPHEQEPTQDGLGEDDFYEDGLADLIVSQIGVEQQNIVTDPMLNGWQDSAGNESTDECRNFFAVASGSSTGVLETEAGTLSNQSLGGVHAYVNDAFNLAALKEEYPGIPCLTGITLLPEFNTPNTVQAGEIVGFDGMESRITLNAGVKFSASGKEEPTYPVFTWNFGDGSPEVTGYGPNAPNGNSPADSPCSAPWLSPCASAAFHSYQYGGTYDVTLKITDVGGNTAVISHEVTVVGPPRPSSGGGSGSGSGGSGSGGSSSTSSSPTSSPSALNGVPAPVAAAAVLPQSLHNALHKGLIVNYSVNEQVAGHFEVLLDSELAHRLKISGTPATGLPAGTPAELVIAKAILVTTKGGRSAVRIQFPKRTAERLARAHKVPLMLRLIVRNAATGTPVTTTVLSSFTLG
jgi:hypothetical protein